MKPSGKHKHDKENELGEHTHQYEDLDDEGLKLIVKGKLKNLPNFSFKKPKTEKQKKEAQDKKEEKKKNKKEQLNELIDTIENNFSKFQQKKQIAQQSSGSSIPIPIYIPQYTQPSGTNLNVDTLTEINDMILKKENELKQYYEREYKKSFSEVDRQYKQIETQTEPDDYEKKLKELNDYYNELLKYRDDLQKERDELSKQGNISQQERNEYNNKLKELDDLYNELLRERQELEEFRIEEEKRAIGDFTNIRLPSQLTQQQETEFIPPSVPPLNLDVLELFGTPREDEEIEETFDTPRDDIIQPELRPSSEEEFEPMRLPPQLTPSSEEEFQPIQLPPPLPMPSIPQLTPAREADEFQPSLEQQPKLSEGFELVEFEKPELPTRPQLIISQEQEEEQAKPISEDIVDLLDILDDTVISRFKQSEPYLELEERADRAEAERDDAMEQISQLKNTMQNIEQDLLDLGQEDIEMREADKAVIEEELRLKIQEAEEAQTENERELAIKEAEILENKLKGAETTKQLKEELEKLKEQTKKELELKEQQIQELEETQQNMLLRGRGQDDEIKKLQSKADIKNSDEFQYLIQLGVKEDRIAKRPQQFYELLNAIEEIQENEPDKLNDIINTANANAKGITDYIERIKSKKIVKTRKFEDYKGFVLTPEEQQQQQQQQEQAEKEAEAISEEELKPLIELENAVEKQTRKVKKKEEEIEEFEKEHSQLTRELEDYNDILSVAFQNVGINSLDDIEALEDENEREKLKESYNFIKTSINNLSNILEELDEKKNKKIRELLQDKSDLDELFDKFKAEQERIKS